MFYRKRIFQLSIDYGFISIDLVDDEKDCLETIPWYFLGSILLS